MNQRVQELGTRAAKQEKALAKETARFSAEIAELKGHILELEQSGNSISGAAAPGTPATTANGVNHTLRSKVLKLHRLGQSPDRIAGSLRVPRVKWTCW